MLEKIFMGISGFYNWSLLIWILVRTFGNYLERKNRSPFRTVILERIILAIAIGSGLVGLLIPLLISNDSHLAKVNDVLLGGFSSILIEAIFYTCVNANSNDKQASLSTNAGRNHCKNIEKLIVGILYCLILITGMIVGYHDPQKVIIFYGSFVGSFLCLYSIDEFVGLGFSKAFYDSAKPQLDALKFLSTEKISKFSIEWTFKQYFCIMFILFLGLNVILILLKNPEQP